MLKLSKVELTPVGSTAGLVLGSSIVDLVLGCSIAELSLN